MHPYSETCHCHDCKAYRYMVYYSGGPLSTNDPFPPPKYCNICQMYYVGDHRHGTRTGRFKVNKPNTEQKPRVRHPGQYRRIYDIAMDVINFQYKPWPDHEWVTYYTVTWEQIVNTRTEIAKSQFNKNAAAALDLERFYKVERVDQTA